MVVVAAVKPGRRVSHEELPKVPDQKGNTSQCFYRLYMATLEEKINEGKRGEVNERGSDTAFPPMWLSPCGSFRFCKSIEAEEPV